MLGTQATHASSASIIEVPVLRLVPAIDPEPFVKPLPMTNLAYIASVDWIGQNRDVARRLFVALARAGRDYCQAYHHGPNRAEVIDSLIANKIVSDRAMLDKMQWQARNPNGTFSVLHRSDELYPDQQSAFVLYAADFARGQPEAGRQLADPEPSGAAG